MGAGEIDMDQLFHPAAVAVQAPDRPAILMDGTGEVITYAELDVRINQLAHLLRARGMRPGDGVAIMLENNARFLEVAWAAQSAGLYYTAINRHLTSDEVAYIVAHSGSRVLVASAGVRDVAVPVGDEVDGVDVRLMIDGDEPGWERYEEVVGAQPASPIHDGCEGDFMLYSSGTTGRPKGIRRPLALETIGEGGSFVVRFLSMFGIGDETVYLSPAPLYHAAPLGWCMGVHRLGGTVVVMEKFEPATFLAAVERHRVTHTQVVPTMFVRLLKLDDDVRLRHDVSSLEMVVHSAAPCAPEVKRRMIEWWGPIILESYSSTEGLGVTMITSEEWLAHPGSVGRCTLGAPHVLDEEGNELPVGEVGTLWFENATFEYHGDDSGTARAKNDLGWGTVGDVGYVDDEGYVYLTDRKSFTIISGGVNVYPQEIENTLILHPAVADVAVFGVPDPDFGEAVKAVVQPRRWEDATPELAAELTAFCKERLASYKCPRSIDFEEALPRLETGKLYKRLLRDRYWASTPAS